MSAKEPLDPELAGLFRNEPMPQPPLGASDRVANRLAVSTTAVVAQAPEALPGEESTRALVAGRHVGVLAATFVAGGLLGAIAMAVLRPPAVRVVYVDRPVPSAPASAAPPSPAPSAAPAAPEPSPVPEIHRPSASPSSSRDTLSAERRVLDDARALLASGDAAGALVRLRDHARRFPRGQLVEEREALVVESLVRDGSYDEARARGDQFRARWPQSVFLPAVDATLQSIP